MNENIQHTVEGIKPEDTVKNILFEEENKNENDKIFDKQLEELLEILKNKSNAPDKYSLESWKLNYGKFFVSSIVSNDIYIWRTLNRMEHKQIVSQHTDSMGQDVFENKIIKKCLLWPSPTNDFIASTDAGIIPTLYKQIMYQSGFVDDNYAVSMIRRI